MRKLALILGAIAGTALAAMGAAVTVDAIKAFSDVRIEDTRTSVPGDRVVELDPGKYVVFYEVAGDGNEDGLSVPSLEVRVRRPDSSRPLVLDDYSADFNVTGGGRKAQAIATVDVPEAGRYTIAARGAPDAPGPAVVLGEPVTERVLRLIAGVIGTLAGVGLVALAAAVAIVLALRGRKAPA